MEPNTITMSLENKNILITGSTGFLAKIFVEKLLRIQPNAKKLFLVIRADDTNSAQQRLHDEVIGKDLFRVLKETYGIHFNSFISNKVTPLVGDITLRDLGLRDSDLKKQLWDEVDIVVNIAATTNFDERYDVALGINTLGAKHVLEFAEKCVRLQILLHVSTAYVFGEKSGVILENTVKIGETLNGVSNLDIYHEWKLVKQKLAELQAQGVTMKEERIAMKQLGLQRSRYFGWPNTYVFTKALGEMSLGEMRGTIPLCIIRPSVITSTYKEPFPGWVEGVRTIDSLIVGYGQGKLPCFMGSPDSMVDIIPADMVVNAMTVAMVTHSNQQDQFIYNVGSSSTNPFIPWVHKDLGYHFFTKNPWIGKDGKPVKVKKVNVLTTTTSFYRYITLHYLLPLKILQVVNAVLCNYFNEYYTKANRQINYVLRLVDLYMPYIFFKGVFDESNLESLRRTISNHDSENTFYFDPKVIDWEDYFMNIHLPGIVKYIFKS